MWTTPRDESSPGSLGSHCMKLVFRGETLACPWVYEGGFSRGTKLIENTGTIMWQNSLGSLTESEALHAGKLKNPVAIHTRRWKLRTRNIKDIAPVQNQRYATQWCVISSSLLWKTGETEDLQTWRPVCKGGTNQERPTQKNWSSSKWTIVFFLSFFPPEYLPHKPFGWCYAHPRWPCLSLKFMFCMSIICTHSELCFANLLGIP